MTGIDPAKMAEEERKRRQKIADDKKKMQEELLGGGGGSSGTLGAATVKIEIGGQKEDPAAQKQAEQAIFAPASKALAKELTSKIFGTGNMRTNVVGQEIYGSKNPELIKNYEEFWNRVNLSKPENREAGTAVFLLDHFKPLIGVKSIGDAYSSYIQRQKKEVNQGDELTDEEREAMANEEANAINALTSRKPKRR